MADSNEPKKETDRITVTPKPESPAPGLSMNETVRIHLPTRPPANPPGPIDSPSPMRAVAAAMPSSIPVPMKKTQPLIDLPKIEAPSTAVTIAPPVQLKKTQSLPQVSIDQVGMPLCWGLVGASVAILILQIWNYLT
ncbi:MAG TPA: hypothetical protein VIU85_08845 [Chthoniobacterales bacterium]